MSRIIRAGESAEVHEYKLGGGGSLRFEGRNFHVGKVEGTFSRVELDRVEEKARQEGRRLGAQETEARLKQPLQAALQNLENVLDEVSRFRRELFKDAEAEVLELIQFIARKVLRRELSLQPEILKDIVEKSLEIVEREKTVHIIFNPQDLKIFQAAKPDFLEKFGSSTDLKFAVDPQVAAGAAAIKTDSVEIDITVEQMVDSLFDQIAQSKISDKEVNDDGDKA